MQQTKLASSVVTFCVRDNILIDMMKRASL